MSGTKMTDAEINKRVELCFDMRYKEGMRQVDWVKYCHEHYDDKSEKTYISYWIKSKDKYEEGWRELLSKQLSPAVNTLIELMASDDEKVRQRAIDQVFKYTGNDEMKVAITGQLDISLNWGDDAAIQSE
jgi:hypothetical protein